MDKKFIILIVLFIAILAAGALTARLLSGGEDTWLCENGEWVQHGNPSAPPPAETCGNAVDNNQDENSGADEQIENSAGNNEQIATSTDNNSAENQNSDQTAEANIAVDVLKPGDAVNFPFTVKGRARVFENAVNFEVKDSEGLVIYSGVAMSNSPDIGQFGDFEKIIDNFAKVSASDNIFLSVYWASPKDGSRLDETILPLKIQLGETSAVKVFFSNNKLDPEISCDKVFPVERIIPKTQTPAEQALKLLLAGPTDKDVENGFSTSINMDVKINSLNIENGIAKADFDDQLENGVGGSCRVAAIRAQIAETLKQFPTVNDAVISVNGRTEDILQP